MKPQQHYEITHYNSTYGQFRLNLYSEGRSPSAEGNVASAIWDTEEEAVLGAATWFASKRCPLLHNGRTITGPITPE